MLFRSERSVSSALHAGPDRPQVVGERCRPQRPPRIPPATPPAFSPCFRHGHGVLIELASVMIHIRTRSAFGSYIGFRLATASNRSPAISIAQAEPSISAVVSPGTTST